METAGSFTFRWNFNGRATRHPPLLQRWMALVQELVFENGKDQAGIRLPEDVRVNDLVLRRALEAINEKITAWVKNTFRFKYGAKNKAVQHDRYSS